MKPNIPKHVAEVDQLDEWEKLKIYMNYICSVVLPLNHVATIVDKTDKYYEKNWAKLEKVEETKNLAFIKPVGLKIPTYEYFVSKDRVVIEDFGDNWKERGRTSRYFVQTHGIYDWYLKYKK